MLIFSENGLPGSHKIKIKIADLGAFLCLHALTCVLRWLGCDEICSSDRKGCLTKDELSNLFLLHVDKLPPKKKKQSETGSPSPGASGNVTETSEARQSAGD